MSNSPRQPAALKNVMTIYDRRPHEKQRPSMHFLQRYGRHYDSFALILVVAFFCIFLL
jgi:hypothetical protein